MKKTSKYLIGIAFILIAIVVMGVAYAFGLNSSKKSGTTPTKTEKVSTSKNNKDKAKKDSAKTQSKETTVKDTTNSKTTTNNQPNQSAQTSTPSTSTPDQPNTNADNATTSNGQSTNNSAKSNNYPISAGATPVYSNDPQKAGAYINKHGQEIDPNQTVINGGGTTGNPYNDLSMAEDDLANNN
ncbi:hypothetical protein ACQW5G_04490 [Fructilactobacillus sp. Tb1]|uniref:hypothetical protein n=1 Tax=Fructilactobacillus sp. Tb1 TaxID=3422304 RepID=UPI003D2BE115